MNRAGQGSAGFGAGLFWEEITRWVSGAVTVDELAATLDAARADG